MKITDAGINDLAISADRDSGRSCKALMSFLHDIMQRQRLRCFLLFLQLPTLGRVYGLLVMSGQLSWRDLIAYAMLPYGEGQFWTNASQHYRTFAVQFMAYALEVSRLRLPAHCLYHHAQVCSPDREAIFDRRHPLGLMAGD